ncbi:MAG: putative ribonuclease [Deltaproteobacteria bacterium]|nr:putative ribonuclease [Deltaproteobacteria bacterium]MBM2837814.1 putative ribonuclease [Deltaproteobacteria bacterium]
MEKLESRTVCVDTDIVIDYLRGKNKNQDILPALIKRHEIYISPVAIYELYYGGHYSGKLGPVDDVLAMMVPLDWTVEDSKKAAQIHVSLSKAGETLSVKDVLIAGQCLSRSIPLITRNISHFKRVKGLKVVDGTAYLKDTK